MMLLYLWFYSLMLLLMMLHSCFDFSTCCASAWKGPAKQAQLLCEIHSVSLAASLGDHVCLVGDISVDQENPSCPEEE